MDTVVDLHDLDGGVGEDGDVHVARGELANLVVPEARCASPIQPDT
ncbi:hypothetical protein ABZ816_30540 [Actinosynnema sp. NPDC047251]